MSIQFCYIIISNLLGTFVKIQNSKTMIQQAILQATKAA